MTLKSATYITTDNYDATLSAGTVVEVIGYDEGYVIRLDDGTEACIPETN